jgi:hypothetical protein
VLKNVLRTILKIINLGFSLSAPLPAREMYLVYRGAGNI